MRIAAQTSSSRRSRRSRLGFFTCYQEALQKCHNEDVEAAKPHQQRFLELLQSDRGVLEPEGIRCQEEAELEGARAGDT